MVNIGTLEMMGYPGEADRHVLQLLGGQTPRSRKTPVEVSAVTTM